MFLAEIQYFFRSLCRCRFAVGTCRNRLVFAMLHLKTTTILSIREHVSLTIMLPNEHLDAKQLYVSTLDLFDKTKQGAIILVTMPAWQRRYP